MDLHQLLVNLEGLRGRKDFDPEDRALIMQYQIEVANYEALLALRQNPVFVGLLETFKEEITRINGWLLTNSKQMINNPDVQRNALYLIAKKEVLQSFVDHYSQEPVELINHISERVNHFINH